MAAMTISQLARSAGVGVETVRYYQRRGLLPDPRPQKTMASGIRHYGPDEARRLRFIRQAQAAGFTLEEIGELLRLDSSANRPRPRIASLPSPPAPSSPVTTRPSQRRRSRTG